MFSSNTTQVSSGGYQISRSLRFNSADSAYLNRTPASAGNRRTWTFSTWVKRSQLNSGNAMLTTVNGSAFNYFSFGTSTGDFLTFAYFDGSSDIFGVNTSNTSVFRDVSAWYHIVLYVDTTQATAANRVKIYVNNVEQTLGGTYPTQNYDTPINNSIANIIGGGTGSYTAYLADQYMTEVNFIDGQALTPSSFGETNAQTGVWQPKAYSGSYGTNGFYLNFSDNSNTTAATLGKDYSGNGNNWTPNNFSVAAGAGNDSLVDSPTSYGTDTGAGGTVRGNYTTWNPVGLGGGTLTNGNLDLSTTVVVPAVGTMAMTTGKWYWEITNNSVSAPRIGVYNIGAANPADLGNTANGWCLLNSPSRTYTGGSAVSYGSYSPTTGTVVMVAYDADAGKLWFGQDGTWFASGNPASGTSPSLSSVTGSAIVPAIANGNSGTDTFSANFGQRPFAYTAPSGYKALCTQNLPTPTIGATTATQAGKYFNPVLYTGNGGTQSVTGVGFQPDFVWQKSRSLSGFDGWNMLVDAVRGQSKILASNATDAEYTNVAPVASFNSDGFTTTYEASWKANASGQTYVAWNWKANGSGSTNTAGSITSTVSANTTSGFSVVTFTGTGANATVGHGLGVAPSMVIVKRRSSTGNWVVWITGLSGSNYLTLNTTNALGSASTVWNSTVPTSSVISVGTDVDVNASTATYVAYCWSEVAGYSKFGSYTGNGSSDGPFVYCGFRPAYVLIKRSNDTGGGWIVIDSKRNPYNNANAYLNPNSSAAEGVGSTSEYVQFMSNGFKLIVTYAGWNASGDNIIFAAFAESPFKYSLAR